MTAPAVSSVLCQSLTSNPSRGQGPGPSRPTGPPTRPRSPQSCGWPCPTPWSSCAPTRAAAATTASPAVECRPIRPVRADPPPMTTLITTTTGTTTINPSKGPAARSQGVPRPQIPAQNAAPVMPSTPTPAQMPAITSAAGTARSPTPRRVPTRAAGPAPGTGLRRRAAGGGRGNRPLSSRRPGRPACGDGYAASSIGP
jgi:hypothetical protein